MSEMDHPRRLRLGPVVGPVPQYPQKRKLAADTTVFVNLHRARVNRVNPLTGALTC
jgi:hypothetical protein